MKTDIKEPEPEMGVSHVSDETLRGFVGYHMKRAFNVVQTDLARTLKPFDLRMLTYTALVLIVDNPGLRQSQLADAMDVERPNLVVIIDELERRELIVRDRVPTDRRAYALKATLAGRQLYEKAVAAVTAHEQRLLENMDATTRDTVIAAMQLIQKSLSKG
ncbi:MarR family winged helix-turn-helix transcriptional regulator [Phaeobacter sp. SYSU ZJ3003]|uniref:MarR family winged helix-turn-helix transcriptional regulator n=1 Tax=Phaeobacter sp. SYSU ZJ3003 TaxID=2109330 RepID=UPI00351C43E3